MHGRHKRRYKKNTLVKRKDACLNKNIKKYDQTASYMAHVRDNERQLGSTQGKRADWLTQKGDQVELM